MGGVWDLIIMCPKPYSIYLRGTISRGTENTQIGCNGARTWTPWMRHELVVPPKVLVYITTSPCGTARVSKAGGVKMNLFNPEIQRFQVDQFLERAHGSPGPLREEPWSLHGIHHRILDRLYAKPNSKTLLVG